MKISYKKLWKLLIDKDMKKKDLSEISGVSSTSLAKMGRNENVNTDTLNKLCQILHCNIEEIIEFIDK